MLRHRVPDAAGLEFGEAHLELAAAAAFDLGEDGPDYELVDDAVVGFLHLAGLDVVADRISALLALLVARDALRDVFLVGGRGVEVELRGPRLVERTEADVLLALADVESLLELKSIFLAVDGHDAGPADVDYAKFAAIKEVLRLESVEADELELLLDRHRAAVYEALVHGVGEQDFVRPHHVFHEETLAKGIRIVKRHVGRVAGCLDCVVHICVGREHGSRERHRG